ncbi:MAG: hypothetical protein WBA51_19145 [Erythrobacter sp.]
MSLRTALIGLFGSLCVSASAQQPPDIVAEAARAISLNDARALREMRFTARGFDSKPITVAQLLDRIDGCAKTAEYERGVRSMAHQMHYDCPGAAKPKMKCASATVIVAIDRASSPDVTAYLRHKRLDTPECKLPQLPGY